MSVNGLNHPNVAIQPAPQPTPEERRLTALFQECHIDPKEVRKGFDEFKTVQSISVFGIVTFPLLLFRNTIDMIRAWRAHDIVEVRNRILGGVQLFTGLAGTTTGYMNLAIAANLLTSISLVVFFPVNAALYLLFSFGEMARELVIAHETDKMIDLVDHETAALLRKLTDGKTSPWERNEIALKLYPHLSQELRDKLDENLHAGNADAFAALEEAFLTEKLDTLYDKIFSLRDKQVTHLTHFYEKTKESRGETEALRLTAEKIKMAQELRYARMAIRLRPWMAETFYNEHRQIAHLDLAAKRNLSEALDTQLKKVRRVHRVSAGALVGVAIVTAGAMFLPPILSTAVSLTAGTTYLVMRNSIAYGYLDSEDGHFNWQATKPKWWPGPATGETTPTSDEIGVHTRRF